MQKRKPVNTALTVNSDIITPLLAWYDKSKRILPWRGSKNPYRIWVSEIMLQQTRVEAVKPYYDRFMKELPTLHELAHANEERLLKLWEGLGYYNRVRNMKKAALQIEEEFNGSFPEAYDQIITLPGIGCYTAGAISSIAFGEAVPAVDGNVLRIIARLLLYEEDILSQKAKNEVGDFLKPLLEKQRDRSGDINQALMELGATVCVPNGAPHCEVCPWNEVCLAGQKGVWQDYPRKTTKKPRRIEERTVFIIGDGEKLLLHKRPSKGLLAGMYELYNIEGYLTEEEAIRAIRALSLEPLRIQSIVCAKHIFSHVEWHMRGYRLLIEEQTYTENPDRETGGGSDNKRAVLPPDFVFVSKEETERDYAIPSAFSAYTDYLDIKTGIGKEITS